MAEEAGEENFFYSPTLTRSGSRLAIQWHYDNERKRAPRWTRFFQPLQPK
jgi:hypothetical protein